MANFTRSIAAAAALAACAACISPASAQVARPQFGQGVNAPANLLTPVRGGLALPGEPYYYGPAYSPYYGPGYNPPDYYPARPPGSRVAYCMRRHRSYDPASGTYVGRDGFRHSCR
jgi:hypothetical protein